jgi:hypothetical protein
MSEFNYLYYFDGFPFPIQSDCIDLMDGKICSQNIGFSKNFEWVKESKFYVNESNEEIKEIKNKRIVSFDIIKKNLDKSISNFPIASDIEFHLLEKVNNNQRKCYENETRWILPNPIIISPKNCNAEILQDISGSASVSLIYENDEPIDGVTLEGSLSRSLIYGKASFHLKAKISSLKTQFKLKFYIQYSKKSSNEKQIYEYTLYSNPFSIFSHTKVKKQNQES